MSLKIEVAHMDSGVSVFFNPESFLGLPQVRAVRITIDGDIEVLTTVEGWMLFTDYISDEEIVAEMQH